ncbi:30S ribosomal protein S1 [Candidatus Poribacteria bacterium]|nr:30S ribosomal protein S1 [Candidatus Poribacteria bacterium]
MVPTRGKETTEYKEMKRSKDVMRKIENEDLENQESETDSDSDIPDMGEWFSNNMVDIRVGQVVRGEVIEISDDAIHVDIKYKSEGIIPIEEFGGSTRNLNIKIGDTIDVFLENTEDKNGRVVLSKKKADHYFAWDKVASAYTNNEPIKGRVIRKVKGGLQVDINGVYAFLPASQIDVNLKQDIDGYIGKELEMKIIKLNRSRNNIVLSRRIILEEKRNQSRASLLKDIAPGQLRKGVVKNITHFGAFVDLGGMNGLLHITDISWGRISHPSEVLHVGQSVEVKVLSVDKELGKISLGLKQKTENPWDTISKKFKVGDKVKGRVVSMTDYGAFVELEEGVEGLVHVSEMSWTKRVEHPSELLEIGDEVEVVILNINQDEEKVSLGMKQTLPNPWDQLDQVHPIGSKIKRKIKNVVDFGVFVELKEGFDGFIHISDFSWTKHFNKAQDVYKKDDEIEAIILNIDKNNQKLSLSIKHLEKDPWERIAAKYPIGSDHKAKITAFTEFGLIAELEKDIEGLIHNSQIDNKNNRRLEEIFKLGDELMIKVVKLNAEEHKIGLSQKAYANGLENKEVQEYMNSQKNDSATLGDVVNKI